MKYKRLNNQNIRVYFNTACSMCGEDVDISDKFCRNCGHKLLQLPEEISMDKACKIITEAVRGGITEASAEEGCIGKAEEAAEERCIGKAEEAAEERCIGKAEEEEWVETAPNKLPTDSWECKEKPQCLHGDRDPSTCGHCLPSGACDACVLPSYPPQYNMCPFRGRGFITCKDAR